MPKTKTTTNNKKRVKLTLNAEPGAKIFIVGSFNNWSMEQNQLLDRKGNGLYSCSLLLPPGTYEYKFKIDDFWSIDPGNLKFTKNELGTLNSVLEIR